MYIISPFPFFNSFLLLDLCHKPRLRHQCLGIKLWPHLKFYINFSVLTRTRDAGRESGKFSEMRLLHKLTSHKMCTEGFGAPLHLFELSRPPPSFISLFTLLSSPLPCAFLIATFSHPVLVSAFAVVVVCTLDSLPNESANRYHVTVLEGCNFPNV